MHQLSQYPPPESPTGLQAQRRHGGGRDYRAGWGGRPQSLNSGSGMCGGRRLQAFQMLAQALLVLLRQADELDAELPANGPAHRYERNADRRWKSRELNAELKIFPLRYARLAFHGASA